MQIRNLINKFAVCLFLIVLLGSLATVTLGGCSSGDMGTGSNDDGSNTGDTNTGGNTNGTNNCQVSITDTQGALEFFADQDVEPTPQIIINALATACQTSLDICSTEWIEAFLCAVGISPELSNDPDILEALDNLDVQPESANPVECEDVFCSGS